MKKRRGGNIHSSDHGSSFALFALQIMVKLWLRAGVER